MSCFVRHPIFSAGSKILVAWCLCVCAFVAFRVSVLGAPRLPVCVVRASYPVSFVYLYFLWHRSRQSADQGEVSSVLAETDESTNAQRVCV